MTVSVLLAILALICASLALLRVAADVPWVALGLLLLALAVIVPAVIK